MWIDRLTSSPTLTALELSARFAEQRHRVLAENLANVDVPDFHQRRLDVVPFQKSLQAALERGNPHAAQEQTAANRLELRGDAQVATAPGGDLKIQPVEEPASNVLFQDGTNAKVERLLTDISDNALSYEASMNLLRNRYEDLLRAIRGRS